MRQTVENEKWDPLGPPHSYCMRQLLLHKIGHEKVKIFWKWCFHRWQIPLSLQMRLSKSKQPLSQRKKTSFFHQFNPFFFHHFLSCWFTASSLHPQSSASFGSYVCCLPLFPSPSYCTLTGCYISFSPLIPTFSVDFMTPTPACSIIHSRDATFPHKTWFIHTSELINLIA